MTVNAWRATDVSKAVKESRARLAEENDPQRRLWRTLDFYASPPWAARAGASLIAGNGSMAEPLREYFKAVCATDIHDHGAGYSCVDFLSDAADEFSADWIVTNPPFAYGDRFLELALWRARRGVALLCRLSFVETEARYSAMKQISVLAPFSERVPMQLGPWNPKLSTATAYAWFVWLTAAPGAQRLSVFPPGTKAKHWRPDDADRFGLKGATPLLDGL